MVHKTSIRNVVYLLSFFCFPETDRREEEKEGEDKSQPRSIRDRRRPREKRRSTGVSFWTQDVRVARTRYLNIHCSLSEEALREFSSHHLHNPKCSSAIVCEARDGSCTWISCLFSNNSREMKMTLISSRTRRRAAPREIHR